MLKEIGRPSAMLTYEGIYADPVKYLRAVVRMLGYGDDEISTVQLREVSRAVMGRDYIYHRGEPVPVYIDSFYEPEVIHALAETINEVLDHTQCLTNPDYLEPKVGHIPFH
ncbi:unnamed protein product [Phaeothamnion confervicola]